MADPRPYLIQIREIISGIREKKDTEEIADFVAFKLMSLYGLEHDPLVVNIGELLADIRQKECLEESIPLIIQKACEIVGAIHGSFVEVDHEHKFLRIVSSYGPDWSEEKMKCFLPVGKGLTGIVAATGEAYLCPDVSKDPHYYPLFDYVKSELVIPVLIDGEVWGLINIDGMEVDAFDENTMHLLSVFAEMVAFSIMLQHHVRNQRKLQEQIIQSEKMASLGRAIAGIAHEINNPLTTILGHASLLMLRPPQDTKMVNSIESIYEETIRTAELVKGLLAFARKEAPRQEISGINEIIQATVGLKKYQLQTQDIELGLDLETISYPVNVSIQQLQQVLINLVTNAEQAMSRDGARGKIVISVRRKGQIIEIRVSDNGHGIPEPSRKYIFDPFYTTKEVGQGTGLGLSLATTLIENNGGNLSLEKTSPEGTVFLIELPLMGPLPSLHENNSENPLADLMSPLKSTTHILLVDDEPLVVEPLADYLEIKGFTVSQVKTGFAALDVMQNVTFDLVISDIRMPGMDGLEFYENAVRQFPRLKEKFIFISGDIMRENVLPQIKIHGCLWLEKPFTFNSIMKAIHELLDTASSSSGPVSATG